MSINCLNFHCEMFCLYSKCSTLLTNRRNIISYFFFFRLSQYLSKLWDREFLCLILWISRSVHVYFWRWGVETGGIFSWKYRNERSRVLLWVMSLMRESEHLASHHLSVEIRQETVSRRVKHSIIWCNISTDIASRIKLAIVCFLMEESHKLIWIYKCALCR